MSSGVTPVTRPHPVPDGMLGLSRFESYSFQTFIQKAQCCAGSLDPHHTLGGLGLGCEPHFADEYSKAG